MGRLPRSPPSPRRTRGARPAVGFFYIDPQGNAFPCAYTKGKVPPINLVREEWRGPAPGVTPCTDCSVGPMVEFNSLFRQPLRAAVDAAGSYASLTR